MRFTCLWHNFNIGGKRNWKFFVEEADSTIHIYLVFSPSLHHEIQRGILNFDGIWNKISYLLEEMVITIYPRRSEISIKYNLDAHVEFSCQQQKLK